MNTNANEENNIMSKYFIHPNQVENNPESNNINNLINKEMLSSRNMIQNNNMNQNSQMNSSFESIMTSQTNLNNEIMNDLIGVELPDKKLIKILKVFKKSIKLRNATIKKNFWKRDYISDKLINIKIGNLFPIIEPSQGFCLCLYNYMNNKQFKELICKVESEIILNNDNNIYEKFNMINQEENQMNNLLINPISYMDNNKHRKELIKLLSSIYYRLKSLKMELGKSKENYIFNYLVIKSKIINRNNQPFIYGKLYSIFPNINFQLHEIQKLSLSSKFKLNKLLISKRHTNIENEKGEQLKNGFITMSNEKRIITLTDDTNKKDLQESQSLKQIIFGIWLSLKEEEVSNYSNLESLIYKHRHFIYRKCLEFILASPKIETIYSPSPDEGIFLLIIFFKTSQCYFEVKIIPNEEEKFFKDDNNGINTEYNKENEALENFGNQWLIKTKKFDLGNNNGQFFFDYGNYMNKIKIDNVNNFINEHLNKNNNGLNKKSGNINFSESNNFVDNNNNVYKNNINNNNIKENSNKNINLITEQNNNIMYNTNAFPNTNFKYNLNMNQEMNNQYMMMTDMNNNFANSTNGSFGYTSQGFKESKNINNNNNNNNILQVSNSRKNDNYLSHKKEAFDPLTDIFDQNNNNNDINEFSINSNQNSNNNIPYVNNQNKNNSQNLYNNNNKPNTGYNPNEYLKMGQFNNNMNKRFDNEDNNNKLNDKMNEDKNRLINENKKILNNIGNAYGGDIVDENWINQSNLAKGMNFPLNNNEQEMAKLMNIQNRQNMFGQIMMNNNINILNNINNNNNINNSNRDEISQQSNTNYSQYTLGKKVYSNNCSNAESNSGTKAQDFSNINNSSKNLNQINPNAQTNNLIYDNNTFQNEQNKYSTYSQDMFKVSQKLNFTNNNMNQYMPENIQKEEKATQTEDDFDKLGENINQIQGLNNIIVEQSKSIQMLQNKVNNLEELLAKVNFLLKKKQDKENDMSNDNEINENNENENGESINKSESLKTSNNNKISLLSNLSQNNTNQNINNNNIINNNKNMNINMNNINNINSNKLNEENSNDNLYKIKNSSTMNFVDSNNKLMIGKNKGIFGNEESLDNELSSDLNISDSRNSKELNKSNNVGDKTIEIPKIKYNSTLLNSNNDETENDISSN